MDHSTPRHNQSSVTGNVKEKAGIKEKAITPKSESVVVVVVVDGELKYKTC